MSFIRLLTRNADQALASDLADDMEQELETEFSLSILDRSSNANMSALHNLSARRERLEQSISAQTEELRQTCIAIEAYSKAEEIIESGRLPMAAE